MDEKEIQKLLSEVAEKHKQAIQTEVKAAVAATFIDKEFAAEQLNKFKGICEEQGLKADTIKNLEEAIQKQGEELRKMSANQEVKDETIESIVEKSADDIKKLKNARQGTPTVKIEIPYNVARKTQVTRAGVSGSTMAMRLPDIGQLPYRGLRMSNLFRHAPVGPSSGGFIRFYDQNAITRAAASVAEGATKPESAITWIERSLKIEKIADSIPVTKEAWEDVYFIQSEIQRLLDINLAIKEDSLLYNGDGNTPNITGIYTTALASGDFVTTSASAPYLGSVVTPNVFDLVSSMRVAIMNAKQSKYVPDIFLMNPVDVLFLRLAKDSFGRYLFPTDVIEKLGGMQLVESSAVSQGTLMVGDSRYATIYDLEGVTVEMGYINDQFVKNAMTLLAEKRETLLVRNVDADAFLACSNITTALTNLKSATV